MKKARVKNGIISRMWPYEKVLRDGTTVIKNVPIMHPKALASLVDVPDDAQIGWQWDGEKFAPRLKEPAIPYRNFLLEALCIRLGIDYDELKKEGKELKAQYLEKHGIDQTRYRKRQKEE